MVRKEGNHKTKGFGSMEESRKKMLASMGGRISAAGKKTGNRGFASMDKQKLKEISRLGGRASQKLHTTRPADNNEETEMSGVKREEDAPERDLTSLEDEDNLESSEETQGSSAYSETDEDEDEGLGDGNLGRSTRGGGLGK